MDTITSCQSAATSEIAKRYLLYESCNLASDCRLPLTQSTAAVKSGHTERPTCYRDVSLNCNNFIKIRVLDLEVRKTDTV